MVCWYIHRQQRNAELGYWLGERFVGRGLAVRAAAWAADHLFTVEALHRVEMQCGVANGASRAVAERLGFTQEGIRRESHWITDRFVDHGVYGHAPAGVGCPRLPGNPVKAVCTRTCSGSPTSSPRLDGACIAWRIVARTSVGSGGRPPSAGRPRSAWRICSSLRRPSCPRFGARSTRDAAPGARDRAATVGIQAQHQHRHLWQAERALETFAGAR